MNINAFINETGAEILKSIRAPEFILPTLLLPVAFYAMFAIALPSTPNSAAYQLACFGVFAAMGPAIFGFGVSVANERDRGWLSLKRLAPISGSTYIASKLLATVIVAAFALLLIYLLAGLAANVNLSIKTWCLLLCIHLGAVIPFAFIGLTIGFSLTSNSAIAIANILFLGMAMLGGLWIPISLFPKALQNFAEFLPTFHLAEISLITIEQKSNQLLLQHGFIIIIMTIVFATLALISWSKQRY